MGLGAAGKVRLKGKVGIQPGLRRPLRRAQAGRGRRQGQAGREPLRRLGARIRRFPWPAWAASPAPPARARLAGNTKPGRAARGRRRRGRRAAALTLAVHGPHEVPAVAAAPQLLLQVEAAHADDLLHVGQVLVLVVEAPADAALHGGRQGEGRVGGGARAGARGRRAGQGGRQGAAPHGRPRTLSALGEAKRPGGPACSVRASLCPACPDPCFGGARVNLPGDSGASRLGATNPRYCPHAAGFAPAFCLRETLPPPGTFSAPVHTTTLPIAGFP